MNMKSCLKTTPTSTPPRSRQSSPPPSPSKADTLCRKHVSFMDNFCTDVWAADEWDRTPTEATPKLTYKDMLELKQIQNSLPRADQLPDPFRPADRQRVQVLRKVPLGLLPLLPASPVPSPPASNPHSRSPSPPPPPPPPYPHHQQTSTATVSTTAVAATVIKCSSPPPPMYPPAPASWSTYPPRPSFSQSRVTGPSSSWRTWTPPGRTPSPLAHPPKQQPPRPKFSFLPLLPSAEPEPGEITFPPEPSSSSSDDSEPEPEHTTDPLARALRTDEIVDVPDAVLHPSSSSSSTPVPPSPSSSPPRGRIPHPRSPLPTPPPAVAPSDFSYFSLPRAGASLAREDDTPTPSSSATPPSSTSAPSTPASTPPPLHAKLKDSDALRTGLHHHHHHQYHRRPTLHALPSPALVPPSPFALDMPHPHPRAHAHGHPHAPRSVASSSAASDTDVSEVQTDFSEPEHEEDGMGNVKDGAGERGRKGGAEVRDADADDEDEWETEMQLVELDSGEMTVRSVRVRRR